MTKRTIEIDDTRDDRVASARADLKTWFDDAVKAQPDVDPNDLEPHDTIHEIADGAVPIYTHEIKTWRYLYGSELDQAYEDAGIGHGEEDNYDQVSIYCYIEQELWNYWRDLVASVPASDDEAAQ